MSFDNEYFPSKSSLQSTQISPPPDLGFLPSESMSAMEEQITTVETSNNMNVGDTTNSMESISIQDLLAVLFDGSISSSKEDQRSKHLMEHPDHSSSGYDSDCLYSASLEHRHKDVKTLGCFEATTLEEQLDYDSSLLTCQMVKLQQQQQQEEGLLVSSTSQIKRYKDYHQIKLPTPKHMSPFKRHVKNGLILPNRLLNGHHALTEASELIGDTLLRATCAMSPTLVTNASNQQLQQMEQEKLKILETLRNSSSVSTNTQKAISHRYRRRVSHDFRFRCRICGNQPIVQEYVKCEEPICQRIFCNKCLSICLGSRGNQEGFFSEAARMCAVCIYQKAKCLTVSCKESHYDFHGGEAGDSITKWACKLCKGTLVDRAITVLPSDLAFAHRLRDSLPYVSGLFIEIHKTRPPCWRRKFDTQRKAFSFKYYGGIFESRLQAILDVKDDGVKIYF